MAEKIAKYNLLFQPGVHPLQIEMYMVQHGGQWTKPDGTVAGEGLAYHFKKGMSLIWPTVAWHKWLNLFVENYLTHRTMAVIGPASSGKTFDAAITLLFDYYCFPYETTVIACSTTKERLEDRIWGEFKKLHKMARHRFDWLPGHLIEGRQRIVTDDRDDDEEGRDFRNGLVGVPCQKGESYVGLGCFPSGTLVDTPTGKRPIEQLAIGDAVLSAVGYGKVRATQTRRAKTLVRVHLENGKTIDCTPEHPFFTNMGWVRAIDMSPLHSIYSAYECLSLLQKTENNDGSGILFRRVQNQGQNKNLPRLSYSFYSTRQQERMLHQILHDEIEDESSGICCSDHVTQRFSRNGPESQCGNYGKSGREDAAFNTSAVPSGGCAIGAHKEKLDKTACQGRTGIWGLWKQNSNTCRKGDDGSIPKSKIQSRHTDPSGAKELSGKNWLSALLQAGLRMVRCKISRGSGWGQPSETHKERTGQAEGLNIKGTRVDRVEILKCSSDPRYSKRAGGYRVHNLEVEGHPSYSVNGVIVHNSFAGLKNKRMRLVGDELSLLPRAFVDAISNLDKNPDFKGIGMGNPKDTTDALGVLAEPSTELGGWEGGIDQTPITKTWDTKRPQGVALQFVGSDSPNADGKLGIPLLTKEQMDRDVAFYGKDSLWYTMMNQGMMPKGQGSRRVITRQLCENQGARNSPIWLNSNRIKIACLDAAYRAVGGDRCVLEFLEFGLESTPPDPAKIIGNALINQPPASQLERQIIALTETIIVPISNKIKDEPEEQIVRFCMAACQDRGIPPENFFYDSGMRTSLVQTFGRIWSSNVQSIDCMGKPTDDPVSYDIDVPACDYYSKKITQIWYSVRLVIEAGQFRGLTEEVMGEFCAREWTIVGANKIEVEPKDKMKLKTGRSPDLADACAIGVFGAMRLGFVIRRLKGEYRRRKEDDRWRSEAREKGKKFWQSGSLIYT